MAGALKRTLIATSILVVCLSEAAGKAEEDGSEGFKLSINSPRNQSLQAGRSQKNGDILVRLPDNIQEQMSWLPKRDRARMREAILGFPVDAPPSSPTTLSTKTTTIRTTTTTKSRRRKKQHVRPPKQVEVDIDRSPRRTAWSVAWEVHVYFSGTLFVLLTVYCVINVARLHNFSRLFGRGYFVTLNSCLVLVSAIRPIWLFYDPYNVGLSWPRVAAYILVDTGFPCITTAFAVLFLALLRATQVELVSSAFQTPKALGGFCILHFLLSFGVDVTVGLVFRMRYMILILQGVFIVWSLLLSAGYFYIFSAMNKIAMRQQVDFVRTVYPKLMTFEGNNSSMGLRSFNNGSSSGEMRRTQRRPPLARALRLTLGVAVLGSLLGGVQLFSMIKMLGLIKQDMSPNQNDWAWCGYQVSMRVLEVTVCMLLAVIATTPLRSDVADGGVGDVYFDRGGSHLHHHHHHPQPFQNGGCRTLRVDGVVGGVTELNYESGSGCGGCGGCGCCCSNRYSLANGQRRGRWFLCCCRDPNPPRAFEDEIYSEICSNNHSVRQVVMHQDQQQQQRNNHYSSLLRPSAAAAIPMETLGGGNAAAAMVVGSSNTLIVPCNHKRNNFQTTTLLRSRFHDVVPASAMLVGNGGRQQQQQQLQGSCASSLDTALYSNVKGSSSRPSSMLFNDSGFVRFRMMGNDEPTNLPDAAEAANKKSQPPPPPPLRSSQSFDDSVLFAEDGNQREKNIAAAAAAIYEQLPAKQKTEKAIPSESDETPYERGRAPSQCSSISATQSFDVRMYGGQAKRTTVEQQKRLQNPFYYYGSTRNQKVGSKKKPRPLLPSQRVALETASSARVQAEPFQRSQSLGGHYATQQRGYPGCLPGPISIGSRGAEAARSPVGSLTPGRLGLGRRTHNVNPLYDTPPSNRRALLRLSHRSFQEGAVARTEKIRGIVGHRLTTPPSPQQTDPLSPILTDDQEEESPDNNHAMRREDLFTSDDYQSSAVTSSSDGSRRSSRRKADGDHHHQTTSHCYLADVSEVESNFLSPLRYSARLKVEKSLPSAEQQLQLQQQGYSRVATNDGDDCPSVGSLFSSSSSDDVVAEQSPEYRWDGARIDNKRNVLDVNNVDADESENVFTEGDGDDCVEDDDSALADVETDYDDEQHQPRCHRPRHQLLPRPQNRSNKTQQKQEASIETQLE